ncbi:hypothetical protein [Celerinatantimonas diazotrophica]|uniref:Uncharacterized protein n=1 Tax=Celerinatantimonas diazotrophica TaxID=412034 RepID=A0A4R1J972_9GAMM|nr:hypothetical protein [Celerinatantimonas diazotrophica]TCK47136.1 hypothetical protein EV690_2835 [Celerinatantimonas diazotrophica]CAG9295908.1 hypothetical protein CEDIAZO_01042 [Celerinatantimonas diazotrophica]
MQVNNNQSVMDKLSSWMGSKAAPTQQSNNFQEQFLKLRNAGQGDLRQGLAGQQGQSANGGGLSLFGSSADKNALSHQFTQIGEGIGLGLLAAFASTNGGGLQFGTTGDKKSAAAANSATSTGNSKTKNNSTELTSMNTKNLAFGVKSDKPQGANSTPAPAAATENKANTSSQNNGNTEENNTNPVQAANNGQTAGNGQTANASAKSASSGSWNPFSNFFKDLLGSGDKTAASATAENQPNNTNTDTTA